jgi:hypothetical protein
LLVNWPYLPHPSPNCPTLSNFPEPQLSSAYQRQLWDYSALAMRNTTWCLLNENKCFQDDFFVLFSSNIFFKDSDLQGKHDSFRFFLNPLDSPTLILKNDSTLLVTMGYQISFLLSRPLLVQFPMMTCSFETRYAGSLSSFKIDNGHSFLSLTPRIRNSTVKVNCT